MGTYELYDQHEIERQRVAALEEQVKLLTDEVIAMQLEDEAEEAALMQQ